MKLPEIIGLAGTNAAGKDTLGDLRLEKEFARKVSLSDILRVEAARRGLSAQRENLGAIGEEWSKKFGAAALAMMTLEEYWKTEEDQRTGISLVSIRRLAEAKHIQDANGLIIWVDADRELRYLRTQQGNRDRVDDQVTFEEFCAKEDFEMYPASDDPFLMNMAGIREIADVHIENNFVDQGKLKGEDLYKAYLQEAFELAS